MVGRERGSWFEVSYWVPDGVMPPKRLTSVWGLLTNRSDKQVGLPSGVIVVG